MHCNLNLEIINISCSDAIFTLRATLDHFIQSGSSVFIASLGISEAFDRVVSALVSIKEANQHLARLVLKWMTVSGFSSRCGTFISVCGQPSRSTQPGHLFVGRRNEYQPKGGVALRLGSKGRYGSCVGGR